MQEKNGNAEIDYSITETNYEALVASGVEDYCNQVCGGGNCGNDDLCQYGIDSETHMPPRMSVLIFEAARVRNVAGKEVADAAARFGSLEKATAYIAGTPVSKDGNRPWIRDCTDANWRTQFLVIGGKTQNRGKDTAAQR